MPLDQFDSIYSGFPASTPQQWKDKIMADLKGAAFETLISTNADGIPVMPFYTQQDLTAYKLEIPERKKEGWLIAERIKVSDTKTANAEALHALQNGAMTIFFDLQQKNRTEQDIRQLLNGILLDIAPVYFENFQPDQSAVLASLAPGSCTKHILVPQLESKTDELTFAILKAMDQPAAITRIHFFTGSNFFLEIAKLRAFRWLWKQLNDIQQSQLEYILCCETGFQNRSDDDENNNILRNTTEAMSAILGGCDALLINPHNNNEQSAFGKRIARNTQNILLHESGFSIPEDTGKGAYFVEYLTWFLSNKVWQKLQSS